MAYPVVTGGNFFVQREFPAASAEYICRMFAIPSHEKLLGCVWIARTPVMPFCRYGFVITDKALRWKLCRASGFSSEICTGTFFKSETAGLDCTVMQMVAPDASSQLLPNLMVTSGEKSCAFFFKTMTQERCSLLADILKFGVGQGEFPRDSMGGAIRFMPLPALYALPDSLSNAADAASSSVFSFFYGIRGKCSRSRKNEKTAESGAAADSGSAGKGAGTADNKGAASVAPGAVPGGTKDSRLLRACLWICSAAADVCFLFALYNWYRESIETGTDLSLIQIILVCVYIGIKLLYICGVRCRCHKGALVLQLAVTVLVFIFQTNILFTAIIALLLYVSFELCCGTTFWRLAAKLVVPLLICLALLVADGTIYTVNLKAVPKLFDKLSRSNCRPILFLIPRFIK